MHYVVQHGDTLGNIAFEHGTTIHAIMAANGLTNPDMIHVGQTLVIPGLQHSIPVYSHHQVHMHQLHPHHYAYHHPHHHIELRVHHLESRVQHLEHRINVLQQSHVHH
jgi:LysM repeat protein